MASAPWPYADVYKPSVMEAPSWECAEGICQCSDHGTATQSEHSVMLCDPCGARMPGARCRVFANGRVVNDHTPYADGEGWITVVTVHEPETLLIEWAPTDTPRSPMYPFRARYYVDLHAEDAEEAARRRLANLGFSASTLREEVESFQRHYRYTRISGEIGDVDEELVLYHDGACLPVVAAGVPPPATLPLADTNARPLPTTSPSAPPGAPTSHANPKMGGGSPTGQGTLQPAQQQDADCHFSFVLLDENDGSLIQNEDYTLQLHNGTVHQGVIGGDGVLEYGDVPAGDYLLRIGSVWMTVPALNKHESLRHLRLIPD